MSFYTSLSGLQASQTDMSTISNNLANSATSGFKRSSTQFADVMASSVTVSPNHMIGSGVAVKDTRQEFSEGNIIQSQSSLDLAITGDGFFAVKPAVDGNTVNYTRNGSFLVDADGYVTDAQGGHIQIYPVDGSGAVVASGADSLVSLQLPETSGVPIATQNVALDINFNSAAAIPSASSDFDANNPYAFDRFNPATYNQSSQTTVYDANGNAQTMTSYYARDPAVAAAPTQNISLGIKLDSGATTPITAFDRTDPSSYNYANQTTVYDDAGNAQTMTSYYVVNSHADNDANPTWSVYNFVGNQQLTTNGGDTSPVQMTFDTDGTLTAPSAATQFDPFTPVGSTTQQTLNLEFAGSTQSASASAVNSTSQDGVPAGQTTWSVYSFVGDQQLTSDAGASKSVKLTFDSTGALTSPTAATQFDTFVPTGSTTGQTLSLDFAGSTQLTTPFNVNSRSQDGTSVGQLSGVTVDDTGIVKASFSNGDSKILGKVAIANFNNPSGLRQMGHAYWQATGLSGDVKYGEAGNNGFGSLMSGAIEGSNVDITEELVDLIAAQQNFQANAKALDTANQISQTIFNIR